MATRTINSDARAAWSWTAVLAGIVASLTVQVLLTMLALGIGLISIDVPTANTAPAAVSTAALLWWIASGVFAAFVGGAVAGVLAPFANDTSRMWHALAAWAMAVLVVVGFSTFTAGTATTITGNVAGPGVTSLARYQTYVAPRPGAPTISQAQIEQARKAAAIGVLASFVGLLAGALTAAMGGWWSRDLAESAGVETLAPMNERSA